MINKIEQMKKLGDPGRSSGMGDILRDRIFKLAGELQEKERENIRLRAELEREKSLRRTANRFYPQQCEEIRQLRREREGAYGLAEYWKDQALGHIACEQHTETHSGEMMDCPYCVADQLRAELAVARKEAYR